MIVKIELPDDSVMLHMVLIQISAHWTKSEMYQIDLRKESNVKMGEPIQEEDGEA